MLICELILVKVDLPPTKPFFQEFRGERFKLMSYDQNYSGTLDIDLNDVITRAMYEKSVLAPEFRASWWKTPYAVRVDFNSDGFRDKELTIKDTGAFRIVVLGDSYTYGHGLPEPLSWPRTLERLLRQQHPNRRLEVYNLGVGGADLEALTSVMRLAIENWEPDLLIYGYFLNDPQDAGEVNPNVQNMMELDWQYASGSRYYLSLGARSSAQLRLASLIHQMVKAKRTTEATEDWYQMIHRGERWELAANRIEEISRLAAARQSRFMIAVLPLIWRIDAYPFLDLHEKVSELARKNDIELVDGLPSLSRYRDADLYVHPKDRHPNRRYTQVIAEAVSHKIFP